MLYHPWRLWGDGFLKNCSRGDVPDQMHVWEPQLLELASLAQAQTRVPLTVAIGSESVRGIMMNTCTRHHDLSSRSTRPGLLARVPGNRSCIPRALIFRHHHPDCLLCTGCCACVRFTDISDRVGFGFYAAKGKTPAAASPCGCDLLTLPLSIICSFTPSLTLFCLLPPDSSTLQILDCDVSTRPCSLPLPSLRSFLSINSHL